MTVKEVMAELQKLGDAGIKKIMLKHGVKEPFFGVKVEYLKQLQKKIKLNYTLSNELFMTKNADAMYLAGLIAEDEKMTKKDLQSWVKIALSNNISEYTVPWVAAGSRLGYELALEWIDSPQEHISAAGWSTLGNIVALKPDIELDKKALSKLLERVVKKIHTAKNRERYCMNGFIIAAGCYVKDLTKDVMMAAEKIGTVEVDMNGTACKVPEIKSYIQKLSDRNSIGKKKKTVKC